MLNLSVSWFGSIPLGESRPIAACTAPGRLFPSWDRMRESQLDWESASRLAVITKGSPIRMGKSCARLIGVNS